MKRRMPIGRRLAHPATHTPTAMEFPATKRDRLIMGLSIGALILFLANIATFVKQRFFDDRVAMEHTFVVSDDLGLREEHFQRRVERLHKMRRGLRHQAPSGHAWVHRDLGNGSAVWVIEDDQVRTELDRIRAELDQLEGNLSDEAREKMERARALLVEARAGVEEATSTEVLETQSESGRRQYRIVVRETPRGS